MSRQLLKTLLPGILLLLAVPVYAQVNLGLGLVAHYPFNGNANDATGNGHNGQLVNGGPALTADRFGTPNSAYRFDGIDDYIRITDNGAFSTPLISIAFWYKTESSNLQNIIAKRRFADDGTPAGGAQYQFFINHASLGKIASNLVGNTSNCNSNTISSYINTQDNVCSERWYFVVITYDGSVHRMYIDGTLRASGNSSFNGMIGCNSELRIGNWWALDLLPYKGYFDDMRWYNRPLNEQEIAALYNNFQVPTNNWLRLPSYPSYATIGDLDVTGNQLTVEALVDRVPPLNSGTFYGYIVSKHSTVADLNYSLSLTGCELSTTTTGFAAVTPLCQPLLNKTYHVAMVYNGTTLKFYRNGYLMSQTPVTGNMLTNDLPATIGQVAAAAHPLANQWLGYVNEVRIWNVARTQAEIRSFMNTPLASPSTQTGLLGYYTFDNLLNKQGNAAFNATLSGGAAIATVTPLCNLPVDSCELTPPPPPPADTVINKYTPALSLDNCNNILTVQDASEFKAGDTVLLIQMKGAGIDVTNTAAFGTISNYNNAGNYEFNYVKSITGNTIELLNTVERQYDFATGKVQLIRVPYYINLLVDRNIICKPWDGNTGGVLAFNVQNDLTFFTGALDVSGRGFRGATGENTGLLVTNCFNNDYIYPSNSTLAALKGESITHILTNANNKGKGSPANGGGGGLDHNSGGGGGGNAGIGGFGGYQLEPCGMAPFDNRGIGGKALGYSNAANKIFMGGGGGAGHANNPLNASQPSSGGNGGGIIIVSAGRVQSPSTSLILANGGDAPGCIGSDCHDAMGGGGAGGTVLLNVTNMANTAWVQVRGGKGANMTGPVSAAGRIGSGGGGGGGILWASGAALSPLITFNGIGGANGVLTTDGNSSWGATPGQNGTTLTGLVIPVADVLFKKNIDSVRFTTTPVNCNTFQFEGLAWVNTHPVASWYWSFGDNTFANTQNATHTYTTSGTFDVKLVVTDINGCKDSITRSVSRTAPFFDFSYKQDICNPLSVQFTGTASATLSPYWSFGDNNTATGTSNPLHVYAAPGTYIVKYSVTATGCSDTVTKEISINILKENVVLTTDTTICAGTTKQLLSVPALAYCWTPSAYLSDPSIQNPVTSTPGNITYYLTTETLGTNLVVNGDFSAGNTGFTSQYVYATPNLTEAQYYVSANPSAWNPNMNNCPDHTTGSGNMMLVNGSPNINARIWIQTINVQPNTNYAFSTWIQSLNNVNPANLRFTINDIVMGDNINASSTPCQWNRFYTTWNSGNKTTATISITNNNPLALGNDFALDDISFAQVFIKQDSVIITVDSPAVRTSNDVTICPGNSVQLNTTGAQTYSWTPVTGLSSTTIPDPIATPTVTTEYIVTGINANGCTAKDTVNITVLPGNDFDFSYKQDICNPLSVQFTGTGTTTTNPYWSFGDNNTITGSLNPVNLYAATGIYTVKYSAGDGACPDTVTKQISIDILRDNVVLTNDTTICAGTTKQLLSVPALTYCWAPATYLSNPTIQNPITSAPGQITYYLTTETLGNNLVVNGDFSAGNTGFTSQYTYTTPNLAEAQYYVSANPSAWNGAMNNCPDHTSGSENMMLVNGSPNANDRIWTQTINVTPNTNYAFATWIQSLNNVNPANLKFSINNRVIGNNITASSTACQWNRYYTTWNSGNNTTATISIVNNNTLALGNDFALDDISFAQVFVKRDSVIIRVDTPAVRTSNDATICPGIPVQLNTTGAQTYLWTPSTGLSNTTIADPVATPTITTQYIVTGINAHGCTAKDTVDINVHVLPTITITDDTQVCPNTSLQLSVSGGQTYAWTPDPTLDNPASSTPVVTPVTDTWYYVRVTDNNLCEQRDSVHITIAPTPSFTINSPSAICIGESVQLSASGGDIYNWQPSTGLNNNTIANPLANPATTTPYTVTITESACNRSQTLSAIVVVNDLPTVSASRSNDLDCSNDRSQLNAMGAANYVWTPAATLSNPSIQNPVARPFITTDYIVEGTDRNGCTNTATVTVKVEAVNEGHYLMPSGFTPNNDGLNDCFRVKYWGVVQELDFSIYNRWGERVFHTTDPNACWNGKYKGIDQNSGVYVYMIRAKTFCDPSVFRKGTFVLIR